MQSQFLSAIWTFRSAKREHFKFSIMEGNVSNLNRARWKPIEANPAVLKKYGEKLGASELLEFYDILSTQQWALDLVPKDVNALLLVYPITQKSSLFHQERYTKCFQCLDEDENRKELHKRLWFTSQVVENACGTIALLHIFANLNRTNLKKDGILDRYYTHTANMTPLERGKDLEKCQEIYYAHQEFQELGDSEALQDISSEVNEHFIAFVDLKEYIGEFDGRLGGPILHSKKYLSFADGLQLGEGSFLHNAIAIVEQYYFSVNPSEIRFSMVAVKV